jgi:hypothetical protein
MATLVLAEERRVQAQTPAAAIQGQATQALANREVGCQAEA